MSNIRDSAEANTEDRPEMETASESELIDDLNEQDEPTPGDSGSEVRPDGDSGLDDASADASLPEGTSSQTGRLDIADSRMGSGANTGTDTFSRDESDSSMRDAPTDSSLQESEDPSGGADLPTQSGGSPDRG